MAWIAPQTSAGELARRAQQNRNRIARRDRHLPDSTLFLSFALLGVRAACQVSINVHFSPQLE
jgi:hypothetical protein